MGLGYGLLSGLTSDVLGAGAGRADRRELERRARQDLLQERLLNAQIGTEQARAIQLGRPAKGHHTTHADATGTWDVNTDTGERTLIGPGTSRTRNPLVRTDAAGNVFERNVDTGEWAPAKMAGDASPTTPTASGIPAQQPSTPARPTTPSSAIPTRPLRLGVKPHQMATYTPDGRLVVVTSSPTGGVMRADTVGGNLGRPLTPVERQAGEQFGSVDRALTRMERIARYHPEAFTAAIGFIRARGHGLIGRMANEARGALSDPDAQAVVSDYSNYLLTTIPNSRPNQTTVELEQEASLPPFGSEPASWGTTFQTMRDRTGAVGAKGGRATPASRVPARFQP